jgi:hypothetical protein
MKKLKKDKVEHSMMTQMLCRGTLPRNVAFQKVLHEAIFESSDVGDDDGELDVEDLRYEQVSFQLKPIFSKTKISGGTTDAESLFPWLRRLYIVLEDMKSKMGFRMDKEVKIMFPVPQDQIDMSLLEHIDCKCLFIVIYILLFCSQNESN